MNKVEVMAPCVLWIPVYQYTSRCRHPRYPGIDDSTLWISTPLAAVGIEPVVATFWGNYTELYSRNSLESSCRHVDHFCPSRPGVTPGLQDHSYTSVWCNTRPLGPLSARVWCNTRPPEPPLPPSGELVTNYTQLGIPWNCAAKLLEYRWTTLLVSYQDSRTTFLSPPWNPVDSRRLAWWNQASRIPYPSRLQWETVIVPPGTQSV